MNKDNHYYYIGKWLLMCILLLVKDDRFRSTLSTSGIIFLGQITSTFNFGSIWSFSFKKCIIYFEVQVCVYLVHEL